MQMVFYTKILDTISNSNLVQSTNHQKNFSISNKYNDKFVFNIKNNYKNITLFNKGLFENKSFIVKEKPNIKK